MKPTWSQQGEVIQLDPAIASLNVGDEIISRAVSAELRRLWPYSFHSRFPTHLPLSRGASRRMVAAQVAVVGGSNLLDSRIPLKGNWQVNPLRARRYSGSVVCAGVGWSHRLPRQQQWARSLFRALLSDEMLHSVRDSRTEDQLGSLGLNVLNTGCLTMWGLTRDFCRNVPTRQSPEVVFTLTARHRTSTPAADIALIEELRQIYQKLWFFPQARFDLDYYRTLGSPGNATVIGSNLEAYHELLTPGRTDYVGSRLHGGLYALAQGVRSVVVGVDDRARRKHIDFNIPYVEYGDWDVLREMLTSTFSTEVRLPDDAIAAWRGQFATAACV